MLHQQTTLWHTPSSSSSLNSCYINRQHSDIHTHHHHHHLIHVTSTDNTLTYTHHHHHHHHLIYVISNPAMNSQLNRTCNAQWQTATAASSNDTFHSIEIITITQTSAVETNSTTILLLTTTIYFQLWFNLLISPEITSDQARSTLCPIPVGERVQYAL